MKTSTILWMSWARRRFLLPSLMKPLLASIMKMPLRACGVLLVEHDDAGRDAGAVEQVGRQADDALDVAALDDVAADVGLGTAAEQHAVRQNDRALAGALERGEDVQQEGVVAVLGRRDAVLEAADTRRWPGRGRCVQALSENGGLATTKSKVLRPPSAFLKCGLDRVLSCQISAVGQSCRIMFIRASAAGGVVHFLPVDASGPAGAAGFVVRP